ncbi:hypothetical protein B0H19DRAFT_1082370 [Mycena capillaripes]|nr:hypothetical protein B0H19DRAFT_1082370 [Mycena capillaripes]
MFGSLTVASIKWIYGSTPADLSRARTCAACSPKGEEEKAIGNGASRGWLESWIYGPISLASAVTPIIYCSICPSSDFEVHLKGAEKQCKVGENGLTESVSTKSGEEQRKHLARYHGLGCVGAIPEKAECRHGTDSGDKVRVQVQMNTAVAGMLTKDEWKADSEAAAAASVFNGPKPYRVWLGGDPSRRVCASARTQHQREPSASSSADALQKHQC